MTSIHCQTPRTRSLFGLAALLLLTCPTPAQVTTTQNPGESSDHNGVFHYDAGDVDLHFYRPSYADMDDLIRTISQLYGRRIAVEGRQSAGGFTQNLFPIGDAIAIYDTPKFAQNVLTTLREMDDVFKVEDPGAPRYVTLEYQPKYVGIDSLIQALRPFTRPIQPNDQRSFGPQQSVMNISTLPDRGLILVRDTQNQIDAIRSTLIELDQPSPQILATCWVIQGTNEASGESTTALPEDLTENLSQLLPFKNYRLNSVGMLRTAIASERQAIIEMSHRDVNHQVIRYGLSFSIRGFDQNSGALALESCNFQAGADHSGMRRLFATSTTVRTGEYAVLGVAGTEPLFVVLRIGMVK